MQPSCGYCNKKKSANALYTNESFCSSCLIGPLVFAGASVTGIAVTNNKLRNVVVICTILFAVAVGIYYYVQNNGKVKNVV